jgi:hypothetical protein
MPQLDANTMNWLTGVFAPLLAAMVSAAVGAGAALYAVHWEAGRAEKRANNDARRRAQREALLSTYDRQISWLYRAANNLIPDGAEPVIPLPQNTDIWILGDADAFGRLTSLTVELGRRPKHSGVSVADLQAVAEAEQRLRDGVQRQLDRIDRGLEPERMTVTPDLAEALREGQRWIDSVNDAMKRQQADVRHRRARPQE